MLGIGAGAPATAVPRLSDADRDALAVLLSVSGMGPLTLGRLVDGIGSPAEVLRVAVRPDGPSVLVATSRGPSREWHAMPLAVANAVAGAAAHPEPVLREVARQGIRVVTPVDPEYPPRLLHIELPPPALFVRGELAALAAAHVVAVVGTRRPTESGRRVASRIGAALARAGATVVSGLAIGIDGAAHAATLTEKGRTVAFIGGGHSTLFPRAHDRLADAIVANGGAIVSEYAPNIEPTPGTFPQRNRLISGASDAVVVVEAGARSGALVTANWALEQARDCYVVPGPIDAPESAGCNGFLREFQGVARIVSGIPQLLDDLDLSGAAAFPQREPRAPGSTPSSRVLGASAEALLVEADPAERAIGDLLLRGAVTVDELVAATRLSVPGVLRALTALETRGLVLGVAGRYRPHGALAAAPPPLEEEQSSAA